MVDVTLQIFSDHKEGLLRELGQVVVDNHFRLLSQRLERDTAGVRLRLVLRGAESGLPNLEERIACHPRVRQYESFHNAGASPPPVLDVPDEQPAVHQVEAVLGGIAKDYPMIFHRLLGLGRALSESNRAATLRYAGQRVGAWVYKRDFALGGKLTLQDSLKQIALPALKALIGTEFHQGRLRIESTPLCRPGAGGRNGDFFCGYLEGVLGEGGGEPVVVREIRCCSQGETHCEFEVSTTKKNTN